MLEANWLGHLKKDQEKERSSYCVFCMDTAVVAVLSHYVMDNLGKSYSLLSAQFSQFSN